MDTRTVTTGFRMAQWAQIIQERKASGEKVKDYCRNRGLSRDAYFYWQKKLREAAFEQLETMNASPEQSGMIGAGFAEIKIEECQPRLARAEQALKGHVSIEAPRLRITADAAYPADHLAFLLRELVSAC